MRLICLIVTGLLVGGGLASPAAAQERSGSGGGAPVVKKLVISDEAIARAFEDDARASVFQDRPDSLKNGIIIGAVIGGAAMGIFVTALCNALHEPGDPPCWQSTLTAGALGAGIGAAAGAGVDALVARQTPLPTRPARGATAAPRGVMRVRF
jgi:hypothetical protein